MNQKGIISPPKRRRLSTERKNICLTHKMAHIFKKMSKHFKAPSRNQTEATNIEH